MHDFSHELFINKTKTKYNFSFSKKINKTYVDRNEKFSQIRALCELIEVLQQPLQDGMHRGLVTFDHWTTEWGAEHVNTASGLAKLS